MTKAKIAVVGGGIFGVTAAVKLAERGYRVDLFERNRDILMAASGINQYRLHNGYHYPRSADTAIHSRDSSSSFIAEYGAAIRHADRHFYCVSRRDSLTSPEQFVAFCRKLSLPFTERRSPVVRAGAVDLSVEVSECLFDPDRLRAECWTKLRQAGVRVNLGRPADPDTVRGYDFAVVATYADLNAFEAVPQKSYQFEICEKPVLQMPPEYAGQSVVIMDGPFMCLDPFGPDGVFVMGNVVHAIHSSNVGAFPIVDPELQPFLNCGVVRDFPCTKIDRFLEAASEYFIGIEKAEHIGSMLTVRTVLAGQDATDARPTLVERSGDCLVSVLSGKIGTSVLAAREVVAIADDVLEPTSTVVPR